jgi:hypothetical protein
MNHLSSPVSCSLESTYNEIKKEIARETSRELELDNLKAAYAFVHEEICGKPQVSSKA